MTRVLVVAEHLRGAVRPVSLELVSAAAALGGKVAVAIVARDPARLAAGAAVDGVDELLLVPVEADEPEADTIAAAVEALLREEPADLVLAPFSVSATGWAPAVAARLGLGFASDVVALRSGASGLTAARGFYGGKLEGELQLPSGVAAVLLLRTGAWPAAAPASAPAPARKVRLALPPPRVRHVRHIEPAATDVDIGKADFLLSIGRGIGDEEHVVRFARLAERLDATLSCSRPLVDAGWLLPPHQVGQSGQTVAPRVYLALGISGASQHLAGMRGSGTIVAVNTDPEAPIFGVADYGAVADLFAIADELEKLA